MTAPLAALTDAELEERFLEAERNALAWCAFGALHADHRAVRWMEIAAMYQTELTRRANSPPPPPSRKPKRKRVRTRRFNELRVVRFARRT